MKYHDESDDSPGIKGEVRKIKMPGEPDGYIVFDGFKWIDITEGSRTEYNIEKEEDKAIPRISREERDKMLGPVGPVNGMCKNDEEGNIWIYHDGDWIKHTFRNGKLEPSND